jgi:hypothetical protein
VTEHKWVLPGVAAGAVVLVAAGVAIGLGARDPGRTPAAAPAPATAPATATVPTAAPTATARPVADPKDLLVRDGDRVEASGEVRALPGRPVRLCAPVAVAMPGYEPGHEPLPEYCEAGVTLRGLDLDTITDRKLDRDVITGRARVEGTYVGGVVTVTGQTAPAAEPEYVPSYPTTTPCAPPSGGWKLNEDVSDEVTTYVAAHADQYVETAVTYPYGDRKASPNATPYPVATVTIVGTVLDPAVAEAAIRRIYDGNLCVVRVQHPLSTLTRVTDRLVAGDTGWKEHGMFETGADGYAGRVKVRLVVLDAAAQRWLRQADDRAAVIDPNPWVRPLH